MVANTRLQNAKVVHTKLINVIHKKSGVDLRKETFTNSILDASYHNGLLLGDIKLSNKRSHLFLTSILMDTNQNTINAYFDFHMQKQAFSGKVYGSIDDPKVNLNMQKLIQYQMNKQLDSMMGKKTGKLWKRSQWEVLQKIWQQVWVQVLLGCSFKDTLPSLLREGNEIYAKEIYL